MRKNKTMIVGRLLTRRTLLHCSITLQENETRVQLQNIDSNSRSTSPSVIRMPSSGYNKEFRSQGEQNGTLKWVREKKEVRHRIFRGVPSSFSGLFKIECSESEIELSD